MSTSDERPADSGSEVVAEPLLAPADGVPPVIDSERGLDEAAAG